jgi:hypothetical protein
MVWLFLQKYTKNRFGRPTASIFFADCKKSARISESACHFASESFGVRGRAYNFHSSLLPVPTFNSLSHPARAGIRMPAANVVSGEPKNLYNR